MKLFNTALIAVTVTLASCSGGLTSHAGGGGGGGAVNGNDVNLASLTVSAGTLTPAFSQSVTAYTVEVPNTQATITVTADAVSDSAIVTLNGTGDDASTDALINLAVGTNTVPVVVRAPDTTEKTYTITITRLAPGLSSNANLAGLVLSSGTLTPAFSADTISYTAEVENTVTSITVTPTVAGINATVKVNNVSVSSGTASGPIALSVGSNTVTVEVTAEDGTKKTYTVTVTRSDYKVYAAGYCVNTDNKTIPGYWINGVWVALGINDVVSAISVSGENVAALTTNGYWKNGLYSGLEVYVPGKGIYATCIFASGEDVYVGGWVMDTLDKARPGYWKNGDLVILSDPGYGHISVKSIYVDGTDVYVAGTCGYSPTHLNYPVPVYWKNGSRNTLSHGSGFSSGNMPRSIFVSNSILYIGGERIINDGTGTHPGYWTGGSFTRLSRLDTYSSLWPSVNSIVISGGSTYAAGYNVNHSDIKIPGYWKDGVWVELASGVGEVKSIAAYGDDVYCAGTTLSVAGYWKNGSLVNLPHLDISKSARVNSITIGN